MLRARVGRGEKESAISPVPGIGQLTNMSDLTHTDAGDGTPSGWATANQSIEIFSMTITWVIA